MRPASALALLVAAVIAVVLLFAEPAHDSQPPADFSPATCCPPVTTVLD